MKPKLNIAETAKKLVVATRDAYSYDSYGETNWLLMIHRLLLEGYSPNEVEAVVRSKYVRWANDEIADAESDADHKPTGDDLINWMRKNKITRSRIIRDLL